MNPIGQDPLSTPPLLSVQGVSKRYQATSPDALTGIQFQLGKGEILGLLGPSGCGKTTLLRVIAGFERPDQGTVTLGSQVVAGEGRWIPPERRGIGLVFQDFALFPHLTVMQNVLFGLKPKTGDKGSQSSSRHYQGRALEVLDLVGLADLGQRYPHELSGGQQQRVALARALAPRPPLILLDEPLSNLDVQVRFFLRNQIRTILKATETSAVFVTHDQEEALVVSDHVAVMRHGQIEQLSTPEQIYSCPATRFVAEFVTQANFLPVQRQGEAWLTEVGSVHVNPDPGSLTSGEIMIRQEDLQVTADPDGSALLRDCQFLGREYRYCVESASGQMFHALSSARLPLGSRVQLRLAPQPYQVFAEGDYGKKKNEMAKMA